jgi:hypothetical protein
VSLTIVNHDRLAHLGGQLQLLPEHPLLRRTRGSVPKVVQANLADGHYLVILAQLSQALDHGGIGLLRLVRVHPYTRLQVGVLVGQSHRLPTRL